MEIISIVKAILLRKRQFNVLIDIKIVSIFYSVGKLTIVGTLL